jgi:photosystem II stability/assembly factor-like uncharacterized protein
MIFSSWLLGRYINSLNLALNIKNIVAMTRIILLLIAMFAFFNSNAQWAQDSVTGNIHAIYTMHDTILVSNGSEIRISYDDGHNWDTIYNGFNSYYLYCFTKLDSIIFGGAHNGKVWRTLDYGHNWVELDSGLIGNDYTGITTLGSSIFVADINNGVYRSDDYGISWTLKNNGIPVTAVRSLITIGSNIYAGVIGGVYMSSDSGNTWISKSVGMTSGTVMALTARGTTLFVSTYDKLFISTDTANTWVQAGSTLTSNQIMDVAVNNNYVFAATNNQGVFYSTDDGINWYQYNQGLPVLAVNVIEANSTTVYTGTSSLYTALFRSDISLINVIADPKEELSSTHVYPNPAANQITVNVDDKKWTNGSIVFYDSFGRTVGRNTLNSVSQLININLSPSIYFYNIFDEFNNRITSGKLTIE